MDMEKKIKQELRYRKPSEVVDLNLDNCRSPQGKIVGLTDEFLNLELLSMADVGLTSLDGLPKLPKLRKLDLRSNRISRLDALPEKTPALLQLGLRDNKIKDVSTLKPLKKLTVLRSVELRGCEVSTVLDYRELVLTFLSQVTYLDGYDTKAALSSGSELSIDEDDSSDQPEDEGDGTEEDDDVESEDGNTEEEGDVLDDDDFDDDLDDDDEDVDGDDIDDDDVKEMAPAKKRRKCHDDDSDGTDGTDDDDDD